MPFYIRSNIDGKFQTMSDAMNLPITNGVTILDGALVRFVNGRVSLAATNTPVAGVGRTNTVAGVTGNAAGTVRIDVDLLKPGDVLRVEQGVIADGACQPGDTLDIGANSTILAVTANADLRVLHQNLAENIVHCTVVRHQYE